MDIYLQENHFKGLKAIAEWVEPSSSEAEVLRGIVRGLNAGETVRLRKHKKELGETS